jgi:hypothetical protein
MARTTTNIALKVWDLITDKFNHSDLAGNWDKMDAHDHTSGKGVAIPSGGLAPNSVITPKVLDGAITTPKIGDNQVTYQKMAKDGLGPSVGAFYVYRSTGNTASVAHSAQVPFNAWAFDLSSVYNLGTNRFQPTVKGYYRLSWQVALYAALAADTYFYTSLYKPTGVGAGHVNYGTTIFQRGSTPMSNGGSALVLANGTTDAYQILNWYGDSASHAINGSPEGSLTWFCGEFVGPVT